MRTTKRTIDTLTRPMTESQIKNLSRSTQALRKDIFDARWKVNRDFTFNRPLELQYLRLFLSAIFYRDDPLNEMAFKDFMHENGMEAGICRLYDARINVDQWEDEYREEYIRSCKRFDLL